MLCCVSILVLMKFKFQFQKKKKSGALVGTVLNLLRNLTNRVQGALLEYCLRIVAILNENPV